MNKTRSPLTAIAIVLASTTALVAVSDIAAARGGGGGHQETSRQMNAQGNRQVAMSTPSRDMTSKPPVYRDKGSRNDSAHAKKHKGCGKLIVPTAGCPTPARDPVGNTRPSLPTEAKQPTDKSRLPVLEYVKTLGPQSTNQPANAPAHPAVAPASGVAVSNGVTHTTLDPGKGLTASSTGNGSISVSNGTSTVTLAGGSVTLHGAPTVTAGSGVRVVRLSNGDYSVAAAKPAPAAPADKVPPGVTIADDAKFVAHGVGSIVAAPVAGVAAIAGAPIAGAVGAIEGHPVKTLESYGNAVGRVFTDIFE